MLLFSEYDKSLENIYISQPVVDINLGDTNNYLIDIDGDGDVNGHTLVHSHTGSIADVDITQSGVYDNIINLTTSGDNHDIDISQTD